MVYLKVIQKITQMDVSVSGTIDQNPYLKILGGASAPLAPPLDPPMQIQQVRLGEGLSNM